MKEIKWILEIVLLIVLIALFVKIYYSVDEILPTNDNGYSIYEHEA